MNVEFSKLDNVRGEVKVNITEADYADKVKKQLKEISKNRPEPGFRPGHVPEGLLRKKYGDAVKYDVINREVGDAVFNYIKDNGLHVIGNPVPVKNEEFDLANADFTFTFKVGIAPEIDTHVNKDLHIPFYTIKVSDEMIDSQDENLRRRFGKQEPGETVEPDALVKGVITELNPDGSVKEDGIVVENGILAPAYFKSEDQKKLFEGKHVGDVVVFNPAATCESNPTELSSMLNIDKGDVDAHLGDFNFDIKEIIVLRPAEHDQEFFDAVLGKDKVHNDEEYREALRSILATQLLADSNYRFSIDARDIISNAVGDIELPDEILKDYLKQANEALNDENIDEEYVKLRPQLIWELVREAISAQLDVKVEQEDLLQTARMIARQQFAQYGMTAVTDEMLDGLANNILSDKRAHEQIVNQTVDVKLFSAIHEAVSADDKEVSVEEFNALFAQPEENKD
ncbi:MAG: trigger factor [Muribaculaceae bacterium]|nr:trigger factor [Muribaculaceae bacterium]